jgi:hypothetical protein
MARNRQTSPAAILRAKSAPFASQKLLGLRARMAHEVEEEKRSRKEAPRLRRAHAPRVSFKIPQPRCTPQMPNISDAAPPPPGPASRVERGPFGGSPGRCVQRTQDARLCRTTPTDDAAPNGPTTHPVDARPTRTRTAQAPAPALGRTPFRGPSPNGRALDKINTASLQRRPRPRRLRKPRRDQRQLVDSWRSARCEPGS